MSERKRIGEDDVKSCTENECSIDVFPQDKGLKLSQNKERLKRPDKPLYIPRALRCTAQKNGKNNEENRNDSIYKDENDLKILGNYSKVDSVSEMKINFTTNPVKMSPCIVAKASNNVKSHNKTSIKKKHCKTHMADKDLTLIDFSNLPSEIPAKLSEKSLHAVESETERVIIKGMHSGCTYTENVQNKVDHEESNSTFDTLETSLVNHVKNQTAELAEAQLDINLADEINVSSNVKQDNLINNLTCFVQPSNAEVNTQTISRTAQEDSSCEKEGNVFKCLNLSEKSATPLTETKEGQKYLLENCNKVESDVEVTSSIHMMPLLSKCMPHAIDLCKQSDPAEKLPDSWETVFNDEGECLNPSIFKELCDIAGSVQINVQKNDYSDYEPPKECNSIENENIVELYDFPSEFKTQDLISALSFFQEASYTIKWVDDCHALAVFTSPSIANQALLLKHPFIKIRPLSEGIKESKTKARHCARLSEPRKPRPMTSATLARRLVSGALGLKDHATKEQKDTERKILREARERKKLKAKQRQDIWNGIVS